MKVLIIGKGAREHALAQKFAEDERVSTVLVYPGNPGMRNTLKLQIIECTTDNEFLDVVKEKSIGFAFIGPEDYIINGVADKLRDLKIKVIAPSIQAAQLESSKIFSKFIMNKYEIPTAKSFNAFSFDECINLLNHFEDAKIVIKLSGLHAGKGVYIASNLSDAKNKLKEWAHLLDDGVLLEEFLVGYEVSLFYLCFNGALLFLGEATDHKQIYDNDLGDNTGGMGCFSPNPFLTDYDREFIKNEIALKTLQGLKSEGIEYVGILFVGIMMTEKGPKVLEYNVRFGDPETQTILPLMTSGFLDSFLFISENQIEKFKSHHIEFSKDKSVHVVKAAAGYPQKPILNNELIIQNKLDKYFYFAGVREVNDKLYTNGGRVCGLTSLGKCFEEARTLCYEKLDQVKFQGEHYRLDIGKKAL